MPWFFSEEPGAVVSAAIDKYVYVTVSGKYDGTYRAAYSQMETVVSPGEFEHELIRQVLLGVPSLVKGIEIHSIADIPGGTGLGSSSAFTVGLLRAVWPSWSQSRLVVGAIGVEIDVRHQLVGVQDAYPAVYGGIRLYGFEAHKQASWTTIECPAEELARNCLLLDTGVRRAATRHAGDVLAAQKQNREDIRELVDLAKGFAKELNNRDYEICGLIMDQAWEVKRQYCETPQIASWYETARDAGAWGGKLCGAGEGGFMLFMAPPGAHKDIIRTLGLRHVPVKFGVKGSEIVYHD